MIIASNSEIKVDGLGLYAGYAEEVWTVKLKSGGTATYCDVDYHSALSLPTTRYWFDADGEIVLTMGDLARALVDAGVTGASVQVMQVTDNITQTALAVSAGVYAGIYPVVAGRAYPPRQVIDSGSAFSVPFSGNPLMSETYTPETSDDGVTWTAQTSVTTDDYREALVPLPMGTTKFVRLKLGASVVWQCRQMTEWCGDTALLQWTSDSGKTKTWRFEAVSVEREVTETQTTEGSGVFRSTFFPTRKNWKLKATIKVSGLATDETWYFDDLVTGEVTACTFTTYLTMSYIALYGQTPWQAVVTDKKITRSLTAQTTDLTFKLDLLQVRNF